MSNEKLNWFYELIECNLKIDHWKYDNSGTLISSNSEDEKALDAFFCMSENRQYMIDYAKENTSPLILGCILGWIWVAVFEYKEGKLFVCHILGPIFIDSYNPLHIKQRIDSYQLAIPIKTNFIRLVDKVPFASRSTVIQYAIMLHKVITGQIVTNSDFSYQTDPDYSLLNEFEQNELKSERGLLSWMQEQALLNYIREGNIEQMSGISSTIAIDIQTYPVGSGPIQTSKNAGIAFISLCSHAAIEGGLPPARAYHLEEMYIHAIDTANTLSEIHQIGYEMFEDFARRVHKLKQKPDISPPVRNCCEYIQLHASEKLTLKRLACDIGYTEYYLSRKFKKEMGVSITEYMTEQKITMAKNLLAASGQSIQKISEALNFCTCCYFTDTFRKKVGVSPSEYRQQKRKV